MTSTNMWQTDSASKSWADQDLTGYKVEATDGSIGKVHEADSRTGSESIVVDTGRIFGHKVLLPVGMLEGVDHQSEKILVALTKAQIKDAPEFDEATYREPRYRDQVGGYYAGLARR